MQQTKMMTNQERQKQTEEIEKALAALAAPGSDEPASLLEWVHFGLLEWQNGDALREQTKSDLVMQVRLRRTFGEDKFWACSTLEGMRRLYDSALDMADAAFAELGVEPAGKTLAAAYARMMKECMMAITAEELSTAPVDLNLLDAPLAPESTTTSGTTKGTTQSTTCAHKSGTTRSTTKVVKSPRKTVKFKKPTMEELSAYFQERKSALDPAAFYDYYEANGWKVGKNPMVNWKNAVNNWIRKDGVFARQSGNARVTGPSQAGKKDLLADAVDYVPRKERASDA